ncbi:MAG TPA: trypsin-like peptidase domain-containing protein [Acidimicrobiales bacterium]|nr:trypsin-like peptidase domain-containing protein [Acidimicrobiales bacterium]
MEFVDPEDERSSFGSPPPPDDRLWRHPSELAESPPPAPVSSSPPGPRPRGPRPRPPTWVVAGASAVGASLVSTGLVLIFVGLRDGDQAAPVAVERQLARPRWTVASSPIADIAERARAAIVQLRVHEGDVAAVGSGVIFRTDGHVLTSAHLVHGATSLRALLASGREVAATLVGSDPDTDTAVIKLEGGPFPVATLGSAMDLHVGQTAVAIGSSVTVGVISALHREVRPVGRDPTLLDMIQTDAGISPGSSGGALLDGDGAVVGITSAVVTDDPAGSQGFATAIDTARAVADELIRTGRVAHPWLGIEGTDVHGSVAAELGVEGGAMVAQVKEGSPAESGALAPRDVIVGVNGRTVQSMGELVMVLRALGPGAIANLDVVRDGRHRSVAVLLAERPASS